MLGLSAGDTPETLSGFVDAFQVTFPILTDAESVYDTYFQSGGTSPFPLDYVVDQVGRVSYFNTEYDPEAIVEVVEFLLLHPAAASEALLRPIMTVTARPNPFNPRTEIAFDLPTSGPVSLDIHDARGRRVRRLLAGAVLSAGPQAVVWDGADDQGREAPSGQYLIRLRHGAGNALGKLTLLR